jgi:hypothetical protein
VVEIQVERELITAQWVVAFDLAVGPCKQAKMPRLLAMLQDEFLIEFT